MIRLYQILYKINFNKIPSGIELFHSVLSGFKLLSAHCPSCMTLGDMDEYDNYDRYLIDYDKGVQEHIVSVKRTKCAVCAHTHAALPDVLVPHKTYCIIFILRALKEYFHTRAVTAICGKYGIASSTLYAWRDRYLTHATLELGAIVEAALLTETRWLVDAASICNTEAPYRFFSRFGFSFLQYWEAANFSSA